MVAGRRAKQVDPKRFGRFKTDGGFKLLPSLRFELHRTERGRPSKRPAVMSRRLSMITQERAAAEQSRRRSSVARAKISSLLSPGSILAYNASSSRLLVARLKKARLNLRQRCFLLLYEPSSSTLAVVVSFILWSSLIFSMLSSMLESIRSLTDATGPLPWLVLRIGFNGIFTLEVLMRVVCHIPFNTAWRDPYLWVGIGAVLPFWGRMLGSDSLRTDTYLLAHERWMTTRLLESLASVRLVCLCRYYEGSDILFRAIGCSLAQLGVPLFMMLILGTTFAGIL